MFGWLFGFDDTIANIYVSQKQAQEDYIKKAQQEFEAAKQTHQQRKTDVIEGECVRVYEDIKLLDEV